MSNAYKTYPAKICWSKYNFTLSTYTNKLWSNEHFYKICVSSTLFNSGFRIKQVQKMCKIQSYSWNSMRFDFPARSPIQSCAVVWAWNKDLKLSDKANMVFCSILVSLRHPLSTQAPCGELFQNIEQLCFLMKTATCSVSFLWMAFSTLG